MKESMENKLSKFSSEIDPDEIWAAIEPRVDEINNKKRKKRFAFLWALGACGLITLISVGIFQLDKNYSTGVDQTINFDERAQSTSSASPSMSTASKSEEELQEKTDHEEEINHTASESKSQIIITQSEQQLRARNLQNRAVVINSNLNNKPSIYFNNRNENNASKLTEKPSLMTESGLKRQDIDSRQIDVASNKIIIDKSKDNITDLSLETILNEKSKQHNKSNGNVSAEGAETNVVSPLFVQRVSQFSIFETTLNYKPLEISSTNSIYQSNQKPFSFSIGAYGGASIINRNLSEGTSGSSAYQLLRSSTESPLESLNFGASLAVQHKSGFTMSFGYQQTNINEVFKATHVVIDSFYEPGVKYLVINLNQDTVKILGEVPVYKATEIRYEIYNQYRLVELPITIGYTHAWGKWKVGAQAGVLVNLSLKKKGTIFDEDGSLISLSNDARLYNDRLKLGYQLGVSLQRNIFGNLDIKVAPMASFYPSFTKNNQQVKSKYSLVGANIGLMYRIE